MKTMLFATALTCALLAAGFTAPAAEAASRHVVRTHADGDTTVTKAVTRQGPQGGTRARNRTTTADGQGNASTAEKHHLAFLVRLHKHIWNIRAICNELHLLPLLLLFA